jgi:hypothetical protein
MCRYLRSFIEKLELPKEFKWAWRSKETKEFELSVMQSNKKIRDERDTARRLNEGLRSAMADELAAVREQSEGRIKVMEKFYQASTEAMRKSSGGDGS